MTDWISEHEEKAILKVFLSSTLKDLKGMRDQLLESIGSGLESAAMETFVPRGDTSQITALNELNNAQVTVFLVSSYYGTELIKCECGRECSASCGMRNRKEQISYTWCEFRFALAQKKPHLTYIIDEGWEDNDKRVNPKAWKLRAEVEGKEFCPRIKNDEKSIESVLSNLASNIVDWYSESKVDFNRFCGRRVLLKTLSNELNKSVEVTGVGGIGKTALCEVALLIHRLLGREIIYVGSQEGYASGTGYEFASRKIEPYRFSDPTIDSIIDVLSLEGALTRIDGRIVDDKTKVDVVLQRLDTGKGTILYIDGFSENEGIKELIRRGSGLNRGCVLVSSKKELGVAFYRLPIGSIEESERTKLIETMAQRVGKKVGRKEAKVISELAEGHPIATYLLISNIERVDLEKLESFKKGLDFSRDEDVKEYMYRVIKSGISSEAFALLIDLSTIEEEMLEDVLYEALSIVYRSPTKERLGELLDSSIIARQESMFAWQYKQIREAIFEDKPERHILAAEYYNRAFKKHGRVEDEIK
nr:DUF4062 domain-containing protein [Candidatus Njordarchaeota archaeon]